jgi:hypothetical protein
MDTHSLTPMPYRRVSTLSSVMSRNKTHADSLIADSEDGLAVGDDNEINVLALGLLEKICFHRGLVGEGQVQALCASEEMRVVGDRFGLCMR